MSDEPEPSKEDEDFFRLLEEIKAGRQEIDVLLEKPVVKQRLRIICHSFTTDPADADDLANELRTKIWHNLHQFTPDRHKGCGNFFAWVRRIAQNLVIDGFRRKSLTYSDTRPEELVDLLDDRTDIASDYERRAAFEKFWTVVSEFGPMAQPIVEYHLQGYSLREIEQKLADDGIEYSHVSVGNLIRDIVREFFKREEARLIATVSRKGEQPSGRRDKGDSPSQDKRRTGS